MENLNEKPKKKKFSLFCCFSINESGKKRKKKYNSHSNISNTNKTNISEQNINIKVKDFSIEEKKNNQNNINIINKPNENKSKTSSFSYINEDTKKLEKIKEKENETIKNINLDEYNNNFKKFHTSDGAIHNKENKEKTVYLKLYTLKANSNIKEKNININIFEKKENNKNYFLDNSEFIDNFINTNKDEVNIENISLDDHKNISINDKINFGESLSIIEKIKQIPHLHNQEIDDTVNIYGNSSFNRTNKMNEIKRKETDKENINYNNELKIIKNFTNYTKIKSKKKEIGDHDAKHKTDSIVLNKENNKDSNINLYLEMNKKNSSICVPNSKIRLNLSKVLKNYIIDNNNDNKSENKKSINVIKNSDNTLQKKSKIIKNCKSFKTINYVKIEKLGKEIDYNNKTGRFSILNFENNKIDINFNYKNIKNLRNIILYNDINKRENNSNDKIDKEKTISNISQNNSNNNKINNNLNINNNDLVINENTNKLNYINKDDYFNDFLNKEKNNFIEEEEKFIIENANSKTEEKEKEKVENNQKKNNNDIITIKNKLEEEKDKIKEAEENIKDFEGEIEDEQDDLDEESRKINDSKSIISNYIVAPLIGIQDIRSYAPSLCSKSEYKDNISNINDLNSNKGGGFIIPPGVGETEIEIMNENGKEFKSFIETPRASGTYNKRFTHKNINYNTTNNNSKYWTSSNKSMTLKMKNICDKINNNSNEIQKLNEKIIKIEEKIRIHEEYNKKYELWIEKEEEETQLLINMINFLNNSRK